MTTKEKTTGALKPLEGDTGKINYNSFDLAKFICSIMVVIIHVDPLGIHEAPCAFSYINFALQQSICRMAVPLFFVFSGFFLYQKTPLEKFTLEPTKKYIKHILYIYVIWSIVYFPKAFVNIAAKTDSIFSGLIIYIGDFLLSGSYTHLWYLTALVTATMIVSFLLYLKWSPRKILCTSFVFYVFGLLGDAYFGIISPLCSLPVVGNIINLYFKIFDTTRNGLFFAFFFVALGMVLSRVKNIPSTKKSLVLFLISSGMLCAESFLLKKFDIPKDYNILLFAIPSVLFAFFFLKSLKFKDRRIYKDLRVISSLVYYGHLWVYAVVSRVIPRVSMNLVNTPITFVITLVLTIMIGISVMKFSSFRGFRWLKKMY